jgi:signal transduction histidine kinase
MTKNSQGTMKWLKPSYLRSALAVLKTRHFILFTLFGICTLFYYFGELVDFAGWKALHLELWYTVHDIHRLLFLVPIVYASYFFGIRGTIIVTVASLVACLPRAIFISTFPDATPRTVLFTVSVGAIGSLIAMRKQFELELVKLNELKSELLTQKTNQLEEISREVTKLEEEKRNFVRFLGVVAHDLKSPLTVSQSMLWEILGGYSGPVNNDQKDILERITRRIDGLLTLIDDLMDIPFIETGQLVGEMKHISMGEVIKTSVDGFSSLASEKGLKLELTLPPGLSETYGSSRRLQQVMNNLLSNAIKYSRQGTVSVRVSEDDKDIKVEVSDNGIGISSEDLPRLFQDFSRGKNIGEIKGTGLGLSISRRIVEAHGGRIWAESPNPETNTGSRFTFTLPKDNGITATKTGYGKF